TAFKYSTSNELDTYMYIGKHGIYSENGYVYEFRGRLFDIKSNLSLLHKLGWIDELYSSVVLFIHPEHKLVLIRNCLIVDQPIKRFDLSFINPFKYLG
ncbi:unnamed protein product, partial [Rotaria sordida]